MKHMRKLLGCVLFVKPFQVSSVGRRARVAKAFSAETRLTVSFQEVIPRELKGPFQQFSPSGPAEPLFQFKVR